MTLIEFVGALGAGGGVGASAKAGFDYLRARAVARAAVQRSADATGRHEITATLSREERLLGRIDGLEARLDRQALEFAEALRSERAACDARIATMHGEISDLRATCERQEREIGDLREEKDRLARGANALAEEMAAMRREGRR